MRALKFGGLLLVNLAVAVIGTAILESAFMESDFVSLGRSSSLEGIHLQHRLCRFYRVRHVANLAKFCGEVDLDSANRMVCNWLPDNRWARRRVGSPLRFWLWECSECAGPPELFLVHRSSGSCRLLFCWRIPFLAAVPATCGSRVMCISRNIAITAQPLASAGIHSGKLRNSASYTRSVCLAARHVLPL
jgi:hypothetical protein